MEWNRIRFIDCLDERQGLDSLIENGIKFTYAFTDPQFNLDYGKKSFSHRGKGNQRRKSVKYEFLKDSTLYPDKIKPEEYLCWCKNWFSKLKKLCDCVIIYCGTMNLNMWIADIEKPYGIAYLYQTNGKSMDRISYLSLVSPILIYNKPKKRLKRNIFEYIANLGWLKLKFIHPCPLNPDFWFDLINQLTNETHTVLDPFMGTGMTARVCKQLGMKYFGYEINPLYKNDIKKNLKVKKIRKLTQKKLLGSERN